MEDVGSNPTFRTRIMKEEIVKLYKQGLSYNDIVKIVGCSKTTVGYYCSTFSRKNYKITKELAEKINELHSNGNSCYKIGKMLNLSKSTVFTYINNKKEVKINTNPYHLKIIYYKNFVI